MSWLWTIRVTTTMRERVDEKKRLTVTEGAIEYVKYGYEGRVMHELQMRYFLFSFFSLLPIYKLYLYFSSSFLCCHRITSLFSSFLFRYYKLDLQSCDYLRRRWNLFLFSQFCANEVGEWPKISIRGGVIRGGVFGLYFHIQ